jgi:hypothetical protein
MSFNFAIVGGGLTGTTMLCQIVDKLRQNIDLCKLNPSKLKIQIFEKQETFGPGFPHSDRNVMPCCLTRFGTARSFSREKATIPLPISMSMMRLAPLSMLLKAIGRGSGWWPMSYPVPGMNILKRCKPNIRGCA